MRRLLFYAALVIFLAPIVSAGEVVNPSELTADLLIPFGLAFFIALLLWKFMIPSQLSGLLVGFEIDDGLYEVHRLTRDKYDVKELLRLPRVGFGVALYMMAMTGVLLLIAELIFDADSYFLPNLMLMGLLVFLPVIISPWESLNGQLIGKKTTLGKSNKLTTFSRRILTFVLLVASALATYQFLLPQVEDDQQPLVLAIAGLVFMGPTILAYGRIMGASWNMLMIGKFRSFIGKPNPIDAEKLGFVGRLFLSLIHI